MEYVSRYFKPPQSSYFLFGPRGTGKSTWLKKKYDNALYLDLLDGRLYRELLSRPERLKNIVSADTHRKVCIIDEVQRVPGLLPVVHQIIEDYRDIQFILTGSSARKLRRSGTDLLAGRAVLRTFHPFMAGEIGEEFQLPRALSIGMIPLVLSALEPADILNGYASLYLEREVQAESLVRNIDSFARFLEVISFSHGSLLNTTEIARESEIKRTTVQGYLSILEDLLLADFIPVFSRKAKRSLITHNKFYYFDCGVFSSLRPFGPLDKRDEISGPALEGLVYQHLKAWLAYSNYNAGISFWRTRTGLEVDFVIYGDCGFYAFEVKNTDKIHNNELKSLKAFREDYPQCTVCFLYRGEQKTSENGIPCLPVTDFLLNLKPGQIFELFSQSPLPTIE